MLHPLIIGGRVTDRVQLAESRERLQTELKSLPDRLRALEAAAQPYPVSFSQRLQAELGAIQQRFLAHVT